jgi:hypothetical protein
VHAELRARYLDTSANLAYCGQEFRVYRSMKIADAARFYAALNTKWDAAQLDDDLALAGLAPDFEVRRMKRAYQRALVLALACAATPATLVVEYGDEFDEAPAAALLQRAVTRAERAIVTYRSGPGDHAAWYS